MMNTKGYKFQLNIHVEKVQININFQCKMQVLLKRGNQKVETQQLADFAKGSASINETLSLQSNIFQVNGIYQEKKALLTVVIITDKGNKAAGQCSIDFSTYLNQKKYDIYEQFHLDKCPDKHAKLFTKIKLILLGEVDIDAISQAQSIIEEQTTDKKQLSLTPDKQQTESTAKKQSFETQQKKPTEIEDITKQIQNDTPYVSDIEKTLTNTNQNFNTQSQLNNSLQIDEIGELKKQNAEIKDQNNYLIQEIQKEKLQKEYIQQQVQNQKQDQITNNNKYQEQILNYDKKLIQMQEILKQSQMENESLIKQYKGIEQNYKNLQGEFSTLREAFLIEKENARSFRVKLQESQELYKQKDIDYQDLNINNQASLNKIKQLEDQINILNQQILRTNNENTNKILQQNEYIQKLEQQQTQITNQQQQFNQMNLTLQQDLNQKLKDLQTINEKLQKELQEKIFEYQKLQNESQLKIKSMIEQHSQEIKSCSDNIYQQLMPQINQLKQEKFQLEQANISQQEQLKVQESQIQKYAQRETQLQQHLNKSELQLTQQQKLISDIFGETKIFIKQFLTLENIEDVLQIPNILAKLYSQINSNIYKLQSQIDLLHSQIQLQDEKYKDNSSNQQNCLIEQLQNKNCEINDFKLIVENLKSENQHLHIQNEKITKNLNEITNQLNYNNTEFQQFKLINEDNIQKQNKQLKDEQYLNQELQLKLKKIELEQQEIEIKYENQIKNDETRINELCNELKQKENIINQQTHKLTQNENIIQDFTKQNQKFQDKIEELSQQIEQNQYLQSQQDLKLKKIEQENDESKEQINSLNMQLKSYQEKILQKDTQEYEDIIIQNKQKIQEQQIIIEQLEKKIQIQIDEYKQKLDQQNQIHKLELQSQNEKNHIQIQQLEEELRIQKQKEQEQKVQIEEYQQKQDQLQNYQQIIEQLKFENNTLKQQNQELENLNNNLKQNFTLHDKKNQEQQYLHEQQQKQIISLQEKIKEMDNTIKNLDNEKKQISSKLTNDLQELQQQLFSENDEWQKEKDIIQKQVEDLQIQIDTMKESLKEKDQQLVMIQEQNVALKSQNQLLNEVQQKVKEQDKENKLNKIKWQQQIDELNSNSNIQIQNLTNQIQHLEQESEELKLENNELKRQINQKDDDLKLIEEKSKLDIQYLNSNYNIKLREKEDIIQQIQVDLQQFQQSEVEQQSLIKFLESAKENLEKLQIENQQYTQRIQQTNEKMIEQIKEYEVQIISLKAKIQELEKTKDYLEIENQNIKSSQILKPVVQNQIDNKQAEIQNQLIEQMQDQIISLKCKIGDMLNAASDIGGSKLVDKLQCALGIKE